jgi:hypothetical protein
MSKSFRKGKKGVSYLPVSLEENPRDPQIGGLRVLAGGFG